MKNTIKIRLPAILIGLLLFFTACEKDNIVPADFNQEMTPFKVAENTALEMVNEAVAYSSIGMLFDIREGAEVAFHCIGKCTKADSYCPVESFDPVKSNSNRCGEVFTTHLTQPYSYRLLGFEGDVHLTFHCTDGWTPDYLALSTHITPDYASSETAFHGVAAYGKWNIYNVSEDIDAYPVTGYYIRNGIFRYGTQTHERYNYHFRIDVDDLNLLAANYNFKEAFTADFELKVTRWSVAGEEDLDFVEGIIHFSTNGMFFVKFSGGGNVSS
jgi:hypothetical protein